MPYVVEGDVPGQFLEEDEDESLLKKRRLDEEFSDQSDPVLPFIPSRKQRLFSGLYHKIFEVL